MKVLMINPNRFRPHVSPIGLEYVCNSLLREDIEFELVDLNFEPESVIYNKLNTDNVELVGITVRDSDSSNLVKSEFFIPQIKQLVERIKNERECKIVLGGAGFSVFPTEILEYTGADFGVIGYGEEAVPELIRILRETGDLSKIDNLVWLKNGEFQINRLSTGDYENIPPRRRNIVRNKSYYNVYGIGNIEEKRGCFNHCGYCCEPKIVGCKLATRKVSRVIEELKELKSLGIHHVYFCNSEFNLNKQEYLFELYEQLVKSKVGVTWTVSMHPNPKSISHKLLYLMRDAGCQEILLTADSGSNGILASMEKHHTAEDTIKCSEMIRKANIRITPSYIFGWPGESIETIKESFKHMRTCKFDAVALFAGIRIYPSTKLARIAIDEGIIREDTNLLEPVFYQPERVLQEFFPIIRRCSKKLPNCLYPSRNVDFMNLLIRNVYLRGGFNVRGYAAFVDHVNDLSVLEKMKLLGKTALDYISPSRNRFIPIAEATC